MRTIDPAALRAIDPDRLYAPAAVGVCLGRSPDTICRLIAAGKLAAITDPIDPRRRWVRGADVLALAGELVLAELPRRTESARAAGRRAAAAAAEMRRLARAKGGRR